MKTDEIEKLAEKHGGTVIDYSLPEGPQTMDTTIIIATSELAALIAEVRSSAWQEGYLQGIEDERISNDNIGIAGFGAKVEPARQNPYAIRARLEEGK